MPGVVSFDFIESRHGPNLALTTSPDLFQSALDETSDRCAGHKIPLKRIFLPHLNELGEELQTKRLDTASIKNLKHPKLRRAAAYKAIEFIGNITKLADAVDPNQANPLQVRQFQVVNADKASIAIDIHRPDVESEQDVQQAVMDYAAPVAYDLVSGEEKYNLETQKRMLKKNLTYTPQDLYFMMKGLSRMHALESGTSAEQIVRLKGYDVLPPFQPLIFLAGLTAVARAAELSTPKTGTAHG